MTIFQNLEGKSRDVIKFYLSRTRNNLSSNSLFQIPCPRKMRIVLSNNNKFIKMLTYSCIFMVILIVNSIQNFRNIFLYMDTFQFINFATRSWILLKTYKAILHFWYLLITIRSCFMLISVNRLCFLLFHEHVIW